MLPRLIPLLAAVAISFGAMGCQKKPQETAAEKQAKFQAAQMTRAIENYEKLVKQFPESPYAAQAQERVQALKARQAPKSK
ncbi:MAG: outer membrane protein assembly factor BamD [Chthoniobacteraceae bacterium]